MNCPQECQAGESFCTERQIWKCNDDGKKATLVQMCGEGKVCSPSRPGECEIACRGDACNLEPCTPQERECRDGNVYECDADGVMVLYDLCSEEDGEVCDETTLLCAGPETTCMPGAPECPLMPTCTPGDRQCVEQSVIICNPEGTAYVFGEMCADNAKCVDQSASGGFAYCLQNACDPGKKLCFNNAVKLCTAEGEIPAEGEDCGDDVCANATCQPKVCEPQARLCAEGDVHLCEDLGTASYSIKDCPEAAPCALVASEAPDCRPLACTPNAAACVGNALGTCAADGQSLSQVTSNCASSDQVCTSAPACSASAVDAVGAAEQVQYTGPDTVLGNIIDVHSSRRLTKLEAHWNLEAPRDLRWVVYEQTGMEFEVKCSEVTTNHEGSAFFSSSELSCLLEAGKRYVIGVALVIGEDYHYRDDAPYAAPLSFGKVLGSTTGGFSGVTYFESTDSVFRQRITTELP